MKTDTILVTKTDESIRSALSQTQAAADYRGLSHKESLQLRLFAEEMLGMLREITGEPEAAFWVESEAKHFQLHLCAQPRLTDAMREELLSTSTTGKNAAATGVMGKLRDLFERAFIEPKLVNQSTYYMQGALLPYGMEGFNPLTYSLSADMVVWSMKRYKTTVSAEKETMPEAQEEWDELEKSIVANLADEVSVAIQGRKVEMTVYKSFG